MITRPFIFVKGESSIALKLQYLTFCAIRPNSHRNVIYGSFILVVNKSVRYFLFKFFPFFMVSNCCSSYWRDEGWKSCILRYTTQPSSTASYPEASRTIVSEETPCTWQPWLAHTAPGPPQESLVRDETRISLPAKPSLTGTTLGQLCVAPRTSANPEFSTASLTTAPPGGAPSVRYFYASCS
jgi:hypothetical protein